MIILTYIVFLNHNKTFQKEVKDSTTGDKKVNEKVVKQIYLIQLFIKNA